ncbi:MAG: transporter related [Akkermansiaceae bacterium]|nr:transporter related [Akkermansiaceae bacterium]
MGRYPQTGMWGRFKDKDAAAVDSALAALDLESLQSRQIRELSGGQQQRAFLARAIAQEAHVLLLDEPFTGLDRNASRQLGELLEKLSKEGRLVIASHHDLATAPALFDEVLLLKTRPIAFGSPETVLSPANLQAVFDHIPDAEEHARPPLAASTL